MHFPIPICNYDSVYGSSLRQTLSIPSLTIIYTVIHATQQQLHMFHQESCLLLLSLRNCNPFNFNHFISYRTLNSSLCLSCIYTTAGSHARCIWHINHTITRIRRQQHRILGMWTHRNRNGEENEWKRNTIVNNTDASSHNLPFKPRITEEWGRIED